MKKFLSLNLLVLIILSSATLSTFAHPGKVDGRQGHKDEDNVSGLGSYHYHCGNSPAHLHEDGTCPILSIGAFDTSTVTSSKKQNAVTTTLPLKGNEVTAHRDTKNVARVEKMLNRFYTNESYAIELSDGHSEELTNVVSKLDIDFLANGSLVFYTYDLDNNKIRKTTASDVKYSPKTGTVYFSIPKNTGFVIVSAGELQLS